MSTSKLKLNPDKTEFIVFGSKRQRDKLIAYSQLPSWVVLSALLSQSRIWEYGSILIVGVQHHGLTLISPLILL